MAIGMKEIVSATGKAIDHLRSSHFLRSPPRIQITVTMERDAMLLDTHVAHAHFFHELIDRHTLGALEGVNYVEPLGAANFGN